MRALVVILALLPLGYVGLMKATAQPVEWSVVLMMLPFMAFPFIVSRPLAKLTVAEQEKLVRQFAPVFLSRAVVTALGGAIWLWGGHWRFHYIPAPYVGLAIMAVGGLGVLWALVKWLRQRSEQTVTMPYPRPRD